MSKSVKVNVGDNVYTVTKLNTAPASLALIKLTAMLGGSLMSLAMIANARGETDAEREAEQLKIIREAIDDLVQRNDPVKVHQFFEELLTTGYTHKNGALICHLDEFPELEDLFAVLSTSLQLTFGEFIKKQIAKFQAMKLGAGKPATQ